VRSVRRGRQHLFQFKRETLREIRQYLDLVSAEWDQTLGRLKSFVED